MSDQLPFPGEFDTWHNPVAVCPGCGFEIDPMTNGLSVEHGAVDFLPCERCKAELRVEVTVNVLYTTTLRGEAPGAVR